MAEEPTKEETQRLFQTLKTTAQVAHSLHVYAAEAVELGPNVPSPAGGGDETTLTCTLALAASMIDALMDLRDSINKSAVPVSDGVVKGGAHADPAP